MSEMELEHAKTLAVWCSRSSAGYNTGAWQTALLLQRPEFRAAVAAELDHMGLAPDHPAMTIWARELAT